jgi:glucose-1-phosphate thymidylyltransferase
MPIDGQNKNMYGDLVGVIPAAGIANRLGPLPCSKELLPVGFRKDRKGQPLQPKAVGYYLLERMQTAHVSKVYIILRKGKWDIPNYFGDGKMLDMSIAYLLMDLPFGVPFTVDQAYSFIKEATVIFGFPDIIFEPKDAFVQLLSRLFATSADVVLGIFPASDPHKMDMVGCDKEGRVREIQVKPSQTDLQYTWIIAVWTPVFTKFMHECVKNELVLDLRSNGEGNIKKKQELFIGDIIQKALDHNLCVQCVCFSTGTYLDIGTPVDLLKALQFKENN